MAVAVPMLCNDANESLSLVTTDDFALVMEFQLSKVPLSNVAYAVAIIVGIFLISRSRGFKHDTIQTVGSSTWVGSWWAAIKFQTNPAKVIQEGCEKYNKSLAFKVADLYRWVVILRSRDHIGELLRASEDDLSPFEATKDRFQTQYLLPQELDENRYHLVVIRSQLARNVGELSHAIMDEIATAFNEVLDVKDNEWKSVPAVTAVRQIICRASNRFFVGLPLCRDPDWIDLNMRFTNAFVMAAVKLALFPPFMRPLAARFFTGVDQDIARGTKLIRSTVEERLKCLDEYGKDGAELPNDFLSWLMKAADAPVTAETMGSRILGINMAAIHTTSDSLAQALFYLAAHPQYIQPLREEVDAIVEKEGWTKVALVKMRKVNSFLRECQRVAGILFLNLTRKAMRDYTFADGTFIPKGTIVGVGSRAVHSDDGLYEDAQTFKPFRFVDVDESGEGAKHRFVATGVDYLPFGHGKNACPGRFLATNEMISFIAHVVIAYDIKLEGDATVVPPSLQIGTNLIPNPRTQVLFRKRVG